LNYLNHEFTLNTDYDRNLKTLFTILACIIKKEIYLFGDCM